MSEKRKKSEDPKTGGECKKINNCIAKEREREGNTYNDWKLKFSRLSNVISSLHLQLCQTLDLEVPIKTHRLHFEAHRILNFVVQCNHF